MLRAGFIEATVAGAAAKHNAATVKPVEEIRD